SGLAFASDRAAAIHREYDQYRSRPQRDGGRDETPNRWTRPSLRLSLRGSLCRRDRVHQLRPLRLRLEMDDAGPVRLYRSAVCCKGGLDRRDHRNTPAADYVERRVLYHPRCHPGHDDLALSVLLASLAGGGGCKGKPAAKAAGAGATAGKRRVPADSRGYS